MKLFTNYTNRRSFFAKTSIFAVSAFFTSFAAGKMFKLFGSNSKNEQGHIKFNPASGSVARENHSSVISENQKDKTV